MTVTKHRYRYINDPKYPCSYCVQWEWPEDIDQNDDPSMEHTIPMMPTYCVLVLYKGIHKECDEAVAAYCSENSNEL